jgi:hypothetical protein
MVAPSHMSLNDRKAYALLAAYCDIVRDLPEPDGAAQRGISEFLKGIQSRANDVFERGSRLDLDEFLLDAIGRAEQAIRLLADEQATQASSPIVAAIRTRAGQIKCVGCHQGSICRGEEADDIIVAATSGGECIREIKTAFRSAMEIAVREYRDLPAVTVELSTAGLDGCPGQIPGANLAANGWTQFDDEEKTKISRVSVEVAGRHLDAFTATSLSYLMLHEVLCHAFQMSWSSGARPNHEGIDDPVSEGMMDAVAAAILQQKARAAFGQPEWTRLEAEASSAALIHQLRQTLTLNPRFPQAPTVGLGAHALKLVEGIYRADGGQAEEDARRLAYDLNLNSWDFLTRFTVMSRLVSELQPPRNPALIDLLLKYRSVSDPISLINHLTDI